MHEREDKNNFFCIHFPNVRVSETCFSIFYRGVIQNRLPHFSARSPRFQEPFPFGEMADEWRKTGTAHRRATGLELACNTCVRLWNEECHKRKRVLKNKFDKMEAGLFLCGLHDLPKKTPTQSACEISGIPFPYIKPLIHNISCFHISNHSCTTCPPKNPLPYIKPFTHNISSLHMPNHSFTTCPQYLI